MVSSLARLVVLSSAVACASTAPVPVALAQVSAPLELLPLAARLDDAEAADPPAIPHDHEDDAVEATEQALVQLRRLSEGADLLARGDAVGALESLDPLLTDDPLSGTGFFLRGIAHMQLGSPDKALQDLEQATVLSPDDPGPFGLLSRLRADRGELTQAIVALRRSIELGYDEAWSHATLGHLLLESGQWIDAHETLMTAVEIDVDCVPAHRGLASLFTTIGDHERSALAYRAILRSEPDEVAALIGLGHALRDLDDGDAALEPYRHARTLEPERAAHVANIAATLYEVGRYRESIEEYETALTLPDQRGVDAAVIHVSIASLHEKLGNLHEAIDEYEWSLELDPSLGLAHEALGLIEHDADRFAAAERHLAAALELGALRPASVVALARVRGQRGDVGGVEHLVTVLSSMEPRTSEVAYSLAEIHVHSDITEVRDAVEGEALLTPHLEDEFAEHDAAWTLMSDALAAQGRFAEAVDAMERALTMIETTGPRYREYVDRLDRYRAATLAQR